MTTKLRIATYNVHKCKGMDGRVRPERVARVMLRLDADVIAAQEVLGPQAEALADGLAGAGYRFSFGENRKIAGVSYGNATFSRLTVEMARNYDVSIGERERRGVLRTDVVTAEGVVHVFNAHLGTSYGERGRQAQCLLAEGLLLDRAIGKRRVVCGDFNEWVRGRCSRALAREFQSARPRRSYPGVLPLLALDHIYFDSKLALERHWVFRERLGLLASDHLPLLADFRV
ncbi:MAG: endonuclease/exonuclease/phosphatase family protein [Acidobacteriaceae bacterium]